MLKIRTFVFAPFMENTYIAYDEESLEAMVIDPGMFIHSDEKLFDEFMRSADLKVKYLINTHCHIDHSVGNRHIVNTYKPEYMIPKDDLFLLEMIPEQGKQFGIQLETPPPPDGYLDEAVSLTLGSIVCNPILTPGHTPGEYCLYFPGEKVCFTGDVLFRESIGRTDLWGGDYDILLESIRTKLLTLPDDVVIYPGHNEVSTIGEEKRHNPFL